MNLSELWRLYAIFPRNADNENKDAKDLERQWVMQYKSDSFGNIEKSGYQDNISSVSNFDYISNFHSPIVVKNVTDEVALILTVKLRGI